MGRQAVWLGVSLEPSSQTVRMWHLLGMWIMLTFIIIHIYMAIRKTCIRARMA